MGDLVGPAGNGVAGESVRAGELIRRGRQRIGLTQRELAQLAGLSTAAIRDLEQGRTRRPRRESLLAIATALDLDGAETASIQEAAAGGHLRNAVDVRRSGPARISVLGPLRVTTGDEQVMVHSAKRRLLLARLALDPGEVVRREDLAALLWPDGEPRDSGRLLSAHIARIRPLFGRGAVRIEPVASGYRLSADAETLDLLRFRELVADAAGQPAGERFDRLAAAVDVWRGETDIDELRSDPVHAAVVEEYAAALRAWAAVARETAQPEAALARLRDHAAASCLDEPLQAELIATLAASGRQAEALAVFERVRTTLDEMLGIEPSELLRSVHLKALRQEHGPPPRPVRAVQQLPAPPTTFVGRQDEVDAVTLALERSRGPGHPTSRAVIISGPAGVGKTALALTAGHRLRAAYPDGTLYADLRGDGPGPAASEPVPVPTPREVLTRFLVALGIPSRDIGTDVDELAAQFRSELADRRLLILLDNARDARQIRDLVPGAGACDVLVTSRHQLQAVPNAVTIDLGLLSDSAACALIAETSGRAPEETTPDELAATRRLAQSCGRLPLALRIASARLAARPSLRIEDLADRLSDERDRLAQLRAGDASIRASFLLSYENLSDSAKRAFRLNALHPVPPFGLAASAVLLDLEPGAADLVIEELIEASMLSQDGPDRYRFHDLLRLYATELAVGDPEAPAAAARLRSWYIDGVTAAVELAYPELLRLQTHPDPHRRFADLGEALKWLDFEAQSLVALVERLADETELRASAWVAADQMRGYFLIRRNADGWLRCADAGLRAANASGDARARTAMLMNKEQALAALGRDRAALDLCVQAEQLAAECGWRTASAYLSHHVGWLSLVLGELTEAGRWFLRALDLSDDERGDMRAVALNSLGFLELHLGRPEIAQKHLEDALVINRAAGREASMLANRGNLASALRLQGRTVEAGSHLADVLAGYRARGDLRGELSTLDEWSLLHRQQGDHSGAVSAARQAQDIAVILRDWQQQAKTAATLGEALLADGRFADAAERFHHAADLARRQEYPYLLCRALFGLSEADPVEERRRTYLREATDIASARGYHALSADSGRRGRRRDA